MTDSKTYVSDSHIHGKGLFASQDIKLGEVIGIIEGEPTTKDGDHVLWLSDEEGIHVTCDLRYINHAEKPNVCYYDSLEVIALRDIKQGEEFTHFYMPGYESA